MTNTIEEVRSSRAIIRFDAKKCVHSRNCVLGRPDVFVPNVEGEWIHPDAASPDEIAALAANCPSGAITYEGLDGEPNEPAPVVNVVHIRESGPLALHAPLTIAGTDAGMRATLCRCGASKNKPYCDSSHTELRTPFRPQWPSDCSVADQWATSDQGTTGNRHRYRSHCFAYHQNLSLSLRRFEQQTLLRRQSSESWIQNGVSSQ